MDNKIKFDRLQHIPAKYFEAKDPLELKKELTAFIRDLLEHDFHKLCNLIYRHDVSESKFNAALEVQDVELQAEQIAHLVIEREMQKVATRKAYRKFKEDRDKQTLE